MGAPTRRPMASAPKNTTTSSTPPTISSAPMTVDRAWETASRLWPTNTAALPIVAPATRTSVPLSDTVVGAPMERTRLGSATSVSLLASSAPLPSNTHASSGGAKR